MKRFFSYIAAFFCIVLANAQVTVQFIPEINGRNTDGLLTAKFMNGGSYKSNLVLKIDVKEKKHGQVVSIRINDFVLMTGLNELTGIHLRKALVEFGNSAVGRAARQSNFFPEGDYEYCFKIEDEKKASTPPQVYADECFDYDLQPIIPISLIEPYDGEKVCGPQPLLTWQPIVPWLQGVTYQLTIAELRKDQNPVEALYYNIPLLNSRNIFSPFTPYPNSAKPLEKGKSYVWQVSAYVKDLVLCRSEIWVFQYGCNDSTKVEKPEGFRKIEDLVMGNYYVANGQILFAVQNDYTEMALTYNISCLSNPEIKIKKMPRIQLVRGKNNVRIELRDKHAFVNGFVYQMNVKLPDGTEKQLRFVYQNNEQ
jgi:hypothetical protein